MFDWDDFRLFLAAARAGSFTRAAQRLGVDAATVARRVSRLETSLKSTLFVRSAGGLQLTASGARLIEIGTDAETAMAAAEAVGESNTVGGVVRISASEGFGSTILAPALPDLRRQRPGLRIELAANAGFLSPGRREVDMAVTLNAPTDARLKVELLTPYDLGLYASADYLQRRGAPDNIPALMAHDMVGYVDDLIYAPELKYLDEVMPGLRPALASSSIRAQKEMIGAGGGIGVLPGFLSFGLVRVLPNAVKLTRRFWISSHQDVAGAARLRAVRTWLRALVEARQPDLML